jgi:hypothetical protein
MNSLHDPGDTAGLIAVITALLAAMVAWRRHVLKILGGGNAKDAEVTKITQNLRDMEARLVTMSHAMEECAEERRLYEVEARAAVKGMWKALERIERHVS